jgi:hypothetical protein
MVSWTLATKTRSQGCFASAVKVLVSMADLREQIAVPSNDMESI